MTRRRPTLLADLFVVTAADTEAAGLPAVAPVERRSARLATATTPEPGRDAVERCRYGLFTTCSTCGPFNECRPGRLQRFLERRSLIGLMWGER